MSSIDVCFIPSVYFLTTNISTFIEKQNEPKLQSRSYTAASPFLGYILWGKLSACNVI